jgi:hypothetical protein
LWQLFKQDTTKPLSSFMLPTPKHKKTDLRDKSMKKAVRPEKLQQSPRLKDKGTKGKPIIKMAQELVAKKCGFMKEDEGMDTMTLQ